MKEYYICSQLVIDLMEPEEVSKPIMVYPDNEILKENVYVAVLDFPRVEQTYENIDPESEEIFDFWCEQIVPGLMNVDSIQMEDFEINDPWTVIQEKLSLTKDNNRAMTLCNIIERENFINPIQFWNKISNK